MTDRDRVPFARILAGLSEVFAEPVSEARVEGYFLALRSHDLGEVEVMAARALRACKFFPKPAELLEQLEGTEADRGEAAWLALQEALDRHHVYSTVEFMDGALGQTVLRLWGGWPEVSNEWIALSPEMWQARRKEFLAVYRIAARGADSTPMILPGVHEMTNGRRGFVAVAGTQRAQRAVIGAPTQKALER